MRSFILPFLLPFLSLSSLAQESPWEFYIVPNVNLYIPYEGEKQIYPILGYNKESQPKVLVGGLGIGFSAFKPIGEDLVFKAQGNLSKHTYWDEAFELRGHQNEPMGNFVFGSSDFALGLTATVHYFLSEKFSFGTGVGAQLFTTTLSRLPEFQSNQIVADEISVNHYYKTFLPILPLELSMKGKKLLFNIRYEHGLMNRYKEDLGEYKTDRSGSLYFEMGFRIGKMATK